MRHLPGHLLRHLPGGLPRGRDRGSGAIIVVFFAVVVLGLAAFVVDGGLSVAQRERAADIAEQAARYAAQDLDEEALREGDATGAPINYGNCASRVADYVAQVSEGPGDVSSYGCDTATAQRVTVRIQLSYQPVFIGFFYDQPLTVEATATAEAHTG